MQRLVRTTIQLKIEHEKYLASIRPVQDARNHRTERIYRPGTSQTEIDEHKSRESWWCDSDMNGHKPKKGKFPTGPS